MMGGISGLFRPDVPMWAAELSSRQVVVVGASPDRGAIVSRAIVDLTPGSLIEAVKQGNIIDAESVRGALRNALDLAGFYGSELALVIPDAAVRTSFLAVDSLPGSERERLAILRWKLKKTVPFDTDTARVAYQRVRENGNVELWVAMARQLVVEQYEDVVESQGIHAGTVTPSTPAALNLIDGATGDVLFLKKSGASVTTSVLMDGKLRFFRWVSGRSLYDSAYPTLMYYRDKLGGTDLREAILCEASDEPTDEKSLTEQLGIHVRRLYAGEIGDVYKPALGALQL